MQARAWEQVREQVRESGREEATDGGVEGRDLPASRLRRGVTTAAGARRAAHRRMRRRASTRRRHWRAHKRRRASSRRPARRASPPPLPSGLEKKGAPPGGGVDCTPYSSKGLGEAVVFTRPRDIKYDIYGVHHSGKGLPRLRPTPLVLYCASTTGAEPPRRNEGWQQWGSVGSLGGGGGPSCQPTLFSQPSG